jgi:hypothetical protein
VVTVKRGNKEIVLLLLELGNVFVDEACKDYGTPLICAINNGSADIVCLLLEKGMADPNLKFERLTPLAVAKRMPCDWRYKSERRGCIIRLLEANGGRDHDLIFGMALIWSAAVRMAF